MVMERENGTKRQKENLMKWNREAVGRCPSCQWSAHQQCMHHGLLIFHRDVVHSPSHDSNHHHHRHDHGQLHDDHATDHLPNDCHDPLPPLQSRCSGSSSRISSMSSWWPPRWGTSGGVLGAGTSLELHQFWVSLISLAILVMSSPHHLPAAWPCRDPSPPSHHLKVRRHHCQTL